MEKDKEANSIPWSCAIGCRGRQLVVGETQMPYYGCGQLRGWTNCAKGGICKPRDIAVQAEKDEVYVPMDIFKGRIKELNRGAK